jgi:type II secretory pathway component GspD/PulD (secretin)
MITVLNGQEGCMSNGEVAHFLTGVNVQAVNGSLVFVPHNEPYQLGVEVKVRPGLSADGKFVKMTVAARSRDVTVHPVGMIPLSTKIRPVFDNGAQGPEAPFTQFLQDPRIVTRLVDETVTLPDGGTVVFYGGPATTEETIRETAPMFADVPFLQDLMVREKKVTGTNHLLVFATPRVIKPTCCDECVQCAGGTGKLAKLMAEYSRACRDGNTDEARRLAMECLVNDPTCFAQK